MDARTAIGKYMNEDWTDEERSAIEDYGHRHAAKVYGESIIGSSEEQNLPDMDIFREMVFGPESAEAIMHYGALKENSEFVYTPEALQERSEFMYLAQFFDDSEPEGSMKFRLQDGNNHIQLVARPCTDGDGAIEGEKAVRIYTEDLNIDSLASMPATDYEFEINIDAPESVSLEPEGEGIEEVKQSALEEARDQIETDGSFTITAEFSDGELNDDFHGQWIILNNYNPGESTETEQVLDAIGL